MSTRLDKQIAHERRRAGESALANFAEYVEQQQRRAQATGKAVDTHDELDILETLNITDDTKPTADIRKALLGSEDGENRTRLKDLLEARFEEGRGETLFDLGLDSRGDSMDFTEEEFDKALEGLKDVANEFNAVVKVLSRKETTDADGRKKDLHAKLLIRKKPAGVDQLLEIRVAVVGNVDAGKSTLLGVLTKGALDDGRGKSRVNLFRHKHEIESGRTSSVGMEIMGYDAESKIITSGDPSRKLKWEEIGGRACKVIAFTDLAGHERYLRTTVFGLLGTAPDYVMLMVAANNGLIGMSREHLGIATALNVPIMVVVTKVDICPPNILQQTLTQLTKILKSPGARKIPIFVKTQDETVEAASQFVSQRICPIFQVSNVTGQGLDFVRTFLNILPFHGRFEAEGPFEFHVNDCFSVPFVGTVVSGVVKSGAIHSGDSIVIGPDSLGQFTSTAIRSIERKRIPVNVCTAGQSASFALKKMRRRDVRKGMVILPKTELLPKAYWRFTAEVLILSHATTIKPKYQAMLHVGPVSQTCKIVAIDKDLMRTGDRALVAFEFCQRPEYLCVGEKLLFREGRTKGLGLVTAIGFNEDLPGEGEMPIRGEGGPGMKKDSEQKPEKEGKSKSRKSAAERKDYRDKKEAEKKEKEKLHTKENSAPAVKV